MELEEQAIEQIARFMANNITDIKKYIEEHKEEYEEFLKQEESE